MPLVSTLSHGKADHGVLPGKTVEQLGVCWVGLCVDIQCYFEAVVFPVFEGFAGVTGRIGVPGWVVGPNMISRLSTADMISLGDPRFA